MSTGGDTKGYGLILPKSKQCASKVARAIKPGLVKSSVFGNDSSSNSESESNSTDWMKRKLQSTGKDRISNLEGHSGAMKKQAKVNAITITEQYVKTPGLYWCEPYFFRGYFYFNLLQAVFFYICR